MVARAYEHARWLKYAHRDAPVGRRVVLDDCLYRRGANGLWDLECLLGAMEIGEDRVREGLTASDVARRKRDAAPSWADIISTFGEQGAVRNSRGKVVGYNYPKHADPEKNRQVAQKVYEMWDPHRRVSVEAGSNANANIKLTTLENPDTGQVRQVDERHADSVAPTAGFVRKRIARGKQK
jgi:hypothetical protein